MLSGLSVFKLTPSFSSVGKWKIYFIFCHQWNSNTFDDDCDSTRHPEIPPYPSGFSLTSSTQNVKIDCYVLSIFEIFIFNSWNKSSENPHLVEESHLSEGSKISWEVQLLFQNLSRYWNCPLWKLCFSIPAKWSIKLSSVVYVDPNFQLGGGRIKKILLEFFWK